MREALHDGVHEARVAEVLQPLGVVGQRTTRGRCTTLDERLREMRIPMLREQAEKGLYRWKIEKKPTLFQIRF